MFLHNFLFVTPFFHFESIISFLGEILNAEILLCLLFFFNHQKVDDAHSVHLSKHFDSNWKRNSFVGNVSINNLPREQKPIHLNGIQL